MSYEYSALSSEIAEIEEILSELSEDDVIERISFESRLNTAKEELARTRFAPAAKKARLTFRGRPVLGSHGIAADFGSKAASGFADAFAAVAAALNESLRYMGPIPDRGKNQLLITGTAIGSFGFEFEVPGPAAELVDVANQSDEALKKLQELLYQSVEGSDDQMAELVEEIHPRAVTKVADFLTYLVNQQAWCGLEYSGKVFRFNDIEQLRTSAKRLQSSNIKERSESLKGVFVGVLPNDRTFEFRLLDGVTYIKGKISPDIADPDEIMTEFRKVPVLVNFAVMQVGQGRPRYTVEAFHDISKLPPNEDGREIT